MTYPQPAVQGFIAEHFVPVKLLLNRAADQPSFRAYQVIWTPSIVFIDRRGVSHYQSPGYLPPEGFLHLLHIGLARSLIAWSRHDEAAAYLGAVADAGAGEFAAEALYWLGIARYLKARRRAPMMQAWNRLRQEYPSSAWAARIPPNQEAGDEP